MDTKGGRRPTAETPRSAVCHPGVMGTTGLGQDAVQQVALVAQWAAVIVAFVAAAVVAWQSWETRRSAEASRDAVKVANDSLALSREMSRESIRSRIDADMPVLSVTLREVFKSRNTFLIQRPGAQWEEVGEDTVFRLPRDAGTLLAIPMAATIHNDSDRHVDLNVQHLPLSSTEISSARITLAPKGQRETKFAICRSVDGWKEGSLAYPVSSGQSSSVTFGITFEHPADQSANEGWEVRVSGPLLRQVHDEADSWKPHAGEDLWIGVSRHRDYWLSKKNNINLDQMSSES